MTPHSIVTKPNMQIYCRMWRTEVELLYCRFSPPAGVPTTEKCVVSNALRALSSVVWPWLQLSHQSTNVVLVQYSARLKGWSNYGWLYCESSKLWFSTKSLRPRPPVRSRLPPEPPSPLRRCPQVIRKTFINYLLFLIGHLSTQKREPPSIWELTTRVSSTMAVCLDRPTHMVFNADFEKEKLYIGIFEWK